MKLKHVTLAVIAAMVFSSSIASAAFTEATGGSWNGQLDFNGTISNASPMWEFEIPETAIVQARNSISEMRDGTASAGNTSWSLPISGHEILTGRSKVAAPMGGAGIWPQISFGGVDIEESGTVSLVATGSNGQLGTIDFTVNQGHSISNTRTNVDAIESNAQIVAVDTSYAGSLQTRYLTYDKQNPNMTWAALKARTQDSNFQFIIGHRHAVIDDAKVTFPTQSIPATWTASLPMTVTMQ